MLVETLKQYGFSEKEANIYLACLELGETIASSISRKSGENRATTYSVLKELIKKGYISELHRDGVKYFSAISPDKLIKLEERKIDKLKEYIPEMMALSSLYNNKTKVYYYDGFDKLKNLFFEILDEGDENSDDYLSFLGTVDMDDRFKEFFELDFFPKRKKQHRKSKVILKKGNNNYSDFNEKTHQVVMVDQDLIGFGNEIVVYNGKVAILSYNKKEIYGLVIESKVLFESFKSLFNLVWLAYKK